VRAAKHQQNTSAAINEDIPILSILYKRPELLCQLTINAEDAVRARAITANTIENIYITPY